jgi:hypothetical protein
MQELEQKLKWSQDTLVAIEEGNYESLKHLLKEERKLNTHIVAYQHFFEKAVMLDEPIEKHYLILELLSEQFSLNEEEILDLVWFSLFGQELNTYEKRFPLRQRIDYLPASQLKGADYFHSFQFLIGKYFSIGLANKVIEQIVLFEQHKDDALVYLLESFKKYDLLQYVDKLLIIQAYSIYKFESFEVLRHYFPLFDLIDDTQTVYYMAYLATQKNKNLMLNMIELFIDFKITPEALRMKCLNADMSYLQPIDHFYDKFNEFLALYEIMIDDGIPVLTDVISYKSTSLPINESNEKTLNVLVEHSESLHTQNQEENPLDNLEQESLISNDSNIQEVQTMLNSI